MGMRRRPPALAALAALALALSGCMNITLSQAIDDPGPHDSPITIIGVGALGDAAVAAGAAATHASASDTLAFEDVIVYYALPLFALDLLVTIIRIDKYRN
jgi:type IV pilus biogenesis protein CpaD/CtpE